MSIQISWLVEGRVILWKSSGVDDFSEVMEAEEEVIRLFEESSAPLVHIVYDY